MYLDMEPRQKGVSKGWRTAFIFAVLIIALLVAAFFVYRYFTKEPEEQPPVISADIVTKQLLEVQELVTVEYRYTNMGVFEDQKDFYGWSVPLTKKSFIVSYDGIIKAGVDLSGLNVQVSGSTVSVTIPKAEIMSHEIVEDSVEIFDEKDNIFNPIKIEDYAGFTQDQKGKIELKVQEDGLLDQAYQRAQSTIAHILSSMPDMENYTLLIR